MRRSDFKFIESKVGQRSMLLLWVNVWLLLESCSSFVFEEDEDEEELGLDLPALSGPRADILGLCIGWRWEQSKGSKEGIATRNVLPSSWSLFWSAKTLAPFY